MRRQNAAATDGTQGHPHDDDLPARRRADWPRHPKPPGPQPGRRRATAGMDELDRGRTRRPAIEPRSPQAWPANWPKRAVGPVISRWKVCLLRPKWPIWSPKQGTAWSSLAGPAAATVSKSCAGAHWTQSKAVPLTLSASARWQPSTNGKRVENRVEITRLLNEIFVFGHSRRVTDAAGGS